MAIGSSSSYQQRGGVAAAYRRGVAAAGENSVASESGVSLKKAALYGA